MYPLSNIYNHFQSARYSFSGANYIVRSHVNIRILKLVCLKLATYLRTGDWTSIRKVQTKLGLKLLNLLLLPAGLFFALFVRIVRPWLLVRINILTSERMGHFAANTELYLCERDAGINTPGMPYVDLWYHNWPICNQQLARMWERRLHVVPSWLLGPLDKVNAFIPGGAVHRIVVNQYQDRDVHNLLMRSPPHLSFLPEEEKQGRAGLRALGIPEGASFVCLNVRDESYLEKSLPWVRWNYHDYRNCNVQTYALAAQELANRGYYVVRTGVIVKEAMNASHPMIIDYATNGMRDDFMDIYLGAQCEFCISNGTGFDAVPYIFRRPIVYVDVVPPGTMYTSNPKSLNTIKKYWLRNENRLMTLWEIFESGAGRFVYTKEYRDAGIDLIDSTPEEIAAVVLEAESRLKGSWQTTEEDEALQRRFWEIFSKGMVFSSKPLHGEIRSRIGSDFLRRNKALLE